MTNRRVYSISELLRLRPPTQQSTAPKRSAPLSIPRRPSPSPTRSPPSRARHQPLSVSPPATSRSTLLFDGPEAAPRNVRAAPLLPPGFGPPRTNGASSLPKITSNGVTLLSKNTANGAALMTKNSASNGGRGDRAERRIAKGPNLSANFASRIAFANRVASQPPSEPPPKTVQREHDPRRDLELSTEIDRLFAEETKDSTATSKPPVGQGSRPSTSASGAIVEKKQSRFASASSLEDAVTLASVAYPSNKGRNDAEPVVKDGEARTVQDDSDVPTADLSFDDFAKQLAAVAIRADNTEQSGEQNVEQSVSPQNEPKVVNEEKPKETVQNDPTVEALAKWFSSLAAAADVVEGNSRSNYSVEADHQTSEEAKIKYHVDEGSHLPNINQTVKKGNATKVGDDEIRSTEPLEQKGPSEPDEEIDENILSYFELVWKRTVNGDMMEWASSSRVYDKIGDDIDSIDFEVDDIFLSQEQTVH